MEEKVGIEKKERVRLSVLKFSGGCIERLRSALESAKRDYRDVLAWAEYPGYFEKVSSPTELPAEEVKRIIENNWRQYQDWLTGAPDH